jgi:predicted nucleic acid-binding protein
MLYLDASALVKLYVDEMESQAIAEGVERADAVITVRVTYAEARAALARHRREGGLTAPGLRRVVRQLDGDCGTYNVVEVSDALVRRAGALAERHALRGCDAVQLAAALEVRDVGADLQFACCDDRLARAAAHERLSLVTH